MSRLNRFGPLLISKVFAQWWWVKVLELLNIKFPLQRHIFVCNQIENFIWLLTYVMPLPRSKWLKIDCYAFLQVLRKEFDYGSIKDPVAFVSRNSKASYNRLLVFTEKGTGHFHKNGVFHIFQVNFTFQSW